MELPSEDKLDALVGAECFSPGCISHRTLGSNSAYVTAAELTPHLLMGSVTAQVFKIFYCLRPTYP